MKTPQHRAIPTDGDMPVPNFVPATSREKNDAKTVRRRQLHRFR